MSLRDRINRIANHLTGHTSEREELIAMLDGFTDDGSMTLDELRQACAEATFPPGAIPVHPDDLPDDGENGGPQS